MQRVFCCSSRVFVFTDPPLTPPVLSILGASLRVHVRLDATLGTAEADHGVVPRLAEDLLV